MSGLPEKVNQSMMIIYIKELNIYKLVFFPGDNRLFEVIIADDIKADDPFRDAIKCFPAEFIREIEYALASRSRLFQVWILHEKHLSEFRSIVKNPISQKPNALIWVIMNLNDEHQWSIKEIADWLDTLDEQPVFYPATTRRIQNSAFVVTV